MNEATKMKLTSMDVAAERRDELKRCLRQAFPEAFAEGTIDFDHLKRALGGWVDPSKERFGLNWPGKAECMKIIQQPSVATLKPVREESINFDDTANLFIEGDNLEVLKLLQKAYFGKIKMIYIDPPYNTGNEFIYPDKYAETLETYLAYTGQIDDERKRFATNTDTSGRYHTNWLNMMYPRLYLARNLLREDGVIFISIDDHEASNLRGLCDPIFGEENFVAQNVWQKRYSRENRGVIGDAHEYVLTYARNLDSFKEVSKLVSITEAQKKAYRNDDSSKGAWRAIPITAQGFRANQMYEVRSPSGKVFTPPEGRCWSMIEPAFRKLEAEGRIYWGKDGDSQPNLIRYLSEVEGVVPWTWWPHDETGHTDEARKEIREYLGSTDIFDTPKPVRLIRRMLEIAASDDDIVLDFFAGSCTSAHAVFASNASDAGRRRFIMVQLPEPCADGSEALKVGFKTVADIGKERIRRAAKKIASGRDGELNMAANGPADLGFRVFRLDRSNFRIWEGATDTDEDLDRQVEMHIDHLSDRNSAEDVLYELLLKAGFALTTKVQTVEMAGKHIFSIEHGALLICLEKEITSELIDALAEANPLQVICLDEGFKGNDQLKANAVQTFKARAEAEESEIVFRTV
jgi:adenine-specific DNA-methyltransferase